MELTDKIRITNEDNMALMARYPDKYFDLAIVDPPYGIGASRPTKKMDMVRQRNGGFLRVRHSNYDHKDWDDNTPRNEYFDELFRVSQKQIIWGANYFGLVGGVLVWDKLNGESDQYDAELAWLSWTKEVRTVYFMWCGMFQGESCSESVRSALRQQGDKSLNEKRIHPTQKPVALYKWQLKNYATPDMKILDTHLGSGSIAIACHEFGCDLTACELDPDYYRDAIKRIKNHISQTNLFL